MGISFGGMATGIEGMALIFTGIVGTSFGGIAADIGGRILLFTGIAGTVSVFTGNIGAVVLGAITGSGV